MAVQNRSAKSEGAKHRRTAESPAAPGGRVEAAGDEGIDVAHEMEAEARGATYSGQWRRWLFAEVLIRITSLRQILPTVELT